MIHEILTQIFEILKAKTHIFTTFFMDIIHINYYWNLFWYEKIAANSNINYSSVIYRNQYRGKTSTTKLP